VFGYDGPLADTLFEFLEILFRGSEQEDRSWRFQWEALHRISH
jgi:hypothetical protein